MSSQIESALVYKIPQFGNTPPLRFRVSSVDGADLSGGATVQFKMMKSDGTVVIDAVATITGPNDAEYSWQAGETDNWGTFWWQAECTLSDGKKLIGPISWGQIDIIPTIRQGIIV